MRSIIIIGWKDVEGLGFVPENLYTGLDGVAGQKAADAARARGGYTRIGRLTNPAYTPLPIDPRPTIVSGPAVRPLEPKSEPRSKLAKPTSTKKELVTA